MSAAPLRWPKRYWPRPHRVRSQWGPFCRRRLSREGRPNPHWLALLDAENIQTVILDRYEDHNLLRLLLHSSHWAVDFADWRSVILVRTQ